MKRLIFALILSLLTNSNGFFVSPVSASSMVVEGIGEMLRKAAMTGRLTEVAELVSRAGPLEIDSAIEAASEYGNRENLGYLMTVPTSDAVASCLSKTSRALIGAGRGGRLDIVQGVIKRELCADLDIDLTGINSCGIEASAKGRSDVVEYLILHDVEGVPHPDQKGINEFLLTACRNIEINTANKIVRHQGYRFRVPHPDAETIKTAYLEAESRACEPVRAFLEPLHRENLMVKLWN